MSVSCLMFNVNPALINVLHSNELWRVIQFIKTGRKIDINLADVLNQMIKERKTKIVALKDGGSLVGTLDMFDIVAEIVREEAKV